MFSLPNAIKASCLIGIGLSPTLIGATYYVSPQGDDAANGTSPTTPWKTIAQVNTVNLEPGDQVLFEGSQNFTGKLELLDDDNGTPSSSIKISSYGSGRASIDGGDGDAIVVYNTSGIAISNLNLIGSGRLTNTGSGVSCYVDLPGDSKLPYLRISNLSSTGFYQGVTIGGWNNGGYIGFKDIVIDNVNASGNAHAGILTYGYSDPNVPDNWSNELLIIRNCVTSNNSGDPLRNQNSGSGIVVGGTKQATIEFCRSFNNGWDNQLGNGGPVGIWTYDSKNVTIQYNISYDNKSSNGHDGGGFDLDGGVRDSIVQYNYSYNNYGAGYLVYQYSGAGEFGNNIVRYNVSKDDGIVNHNSGIFVAGGDDIKNTKIFNNTIIQTVGTRRGIFVGPVGPGNGLYNNLIITKSGFQIVSSDADLDVIGNAYWSTQNQALSVKWIDDTYSSLSAWRTAAGVEQVNGTDYGVVGDPGVVDLETTPRLINPRNLNTLSFYRLNEVAPLKGKGADLDGMFGISVGKNDLKGSPLLEQIAFNVAKD